MRCQIRSQEIKLNEKERQALRKQIRKTKDRKTADRWRVILYKAEGYTHQHIAHMLQMGINQITKILKSYLDDGLEALHAPNKYKGSAPRLTSEQLEVLKMELKTRIYNTAAQVIAWVEQQWDVSYKTRGMQKLLKRLGFTYKKNRLVPGKADPEAQRQFVQWFTKLRAELGPDSYIYFGDAMHLKHNAEAGYAWSKVGQPHIIPTNSGRQRYNILGAYCTQIHDHVFILTEENINQDSVIELLKRLRDKHGPGAKIYLVLDNASYNKAKRVRAQAGASQINLKYQPPYSPNLNLIERLWKFVRKEFCKDKYRSTFAEFRVQLDDFFANLDQHRAELATLLAENFELLPSAWRVPASA
jgi:transposase